MIPIVPELERQIAELKSENELLKKKLARRFPIMGSGSIPWHLLARHEDQAMKNHDQTLEELASRGGLDVQEAIQVMRDQKCKFSVDKSCTRDVLDQLLAEEAAKP